MDMKHLVVSYQELKPSTSRLGAAHTTVPIANIWRDSWLPTATLSQVSSSYIAFQVKLAARRAHMLCYSYERRTAISLNKNVGS